MFLDFFYKVFKFLKLRKDTVDFDLINNYLALLTYKTIIMKPFNNLFILFLLFNLTSFSQHIKTHYEDGRVIKEITISDITVITSLRGAKRAYGKYYQFDIAIKNNTSNRINFHPQKIIADAKTKRGKRKALEVLTRKQYMKKIKNRQMWSSVLVGISSGIKGSNAGKSSSSTTSSTQASGNVNTSARANVSSTERGLLYNKTKDVDVNANINTSYSENSNTATNTQSYDGNSAYWAAENESKKMKKFEGKLKSIKNSLNNEYIKRHTLHPNKTLSGLLNVKYKKAKEVILTITVKGEKFVFPWNPNDL